MSEDQLTRFEFFVRSHLPKNRVKEIVCETLGLSASSNEITEEMTIIVSSLAKLFCGELMETGAVMFPFTKIQRNELEKYILTHEI